MSEMTGRAGLRGETAAVVHESYSFACMRCGHGWEQSYLVEHHFDADGAEFVVYVVNGRVVPSPLSRPACLNCDGHVVRIMRAGQVSSALGAARRRDRTPQAGPAQAPAVAGEGSGTGEESGAAEGAGAGEESAARHYWHLSDLLHPFQRRAS